MASGGNKACRCFNCEQVPRILVVDDEESMCNFMEIMLKKEGYTVSTAQSGREAMERMDTDHPTWSSPTS